MIQLSNHLYLKVLSVHNNSGNQDDDEEEEDVVDPKSTHTAGPPAKKRNRIDELKQFLEERDNRFLEAMKDMQNTQNKLMEKLIEKLWLCKFVKNSIFSLIWYIVFVIVIRC